MPLPPSNRFLEALSPETRDHLLLFSERIDLPLNTNLIEEAKTPEFAHFLESGFASEVVRSGSSGEAEVGLVGHEGATGLWALLGPAKSSSRCFMQAAGAGYRIPFTHLQDSFTASEEVRVRALEYVQEHTMEAVYLTACNKLHDTEQRLARWLLTVADRLESETFSLTQEYLAQMLGVRRMAVSLSAGALQRSGLIEYTRGRISILNRTGLTASACECYTLINRLYTNLYRGES